MAKILCKYSGLEFKCEYFPVYLDSHESYHPVFSIPPKKLPIYYSRWLAGELNQIDSYLLFLAILRASDLVEFRTSVKVTPETPSLVATYMADLWNITQKLNGIIHPRFSVPVIAITPDTCTLNNIKYWLKTWKDCYAEFLSGLDAYELRSRIQRKEAALEKLIKSPAIPPNKYASSLASWASEAAAFPSFEIVSPLTNSYTTIDAYWREIIIRCYNTESIISVPAKDIDELLTHCEQNLDADIGTIFSHHLFACLQEGKSRHSSFHSIGFESIGGHGFSMITTKDSVAAGNIAILIESAPMEKPIRANYKSDFAYLKAKTKYELAKSLNKKESE